MLHAETATEKFENYPVSAQDEAAVAAQWDANWLMGQWLELSDEFIIIVDRQLRIVAHTKNADEGCRLMTGFPLAHFHDVLQLVSVERRAMLKPLYQEVLNGKPAATEYQVPGPEGAVVFFKTTMKPFRNPSGVIVGVWLHIREITQQVVTEKAYDEAEQRWRFALEGSNHGVWDWDIASGQCYYGPSYLQMYGFAAGELAHHIDEWHARTHPDDKKNIEQALQTHLTGEAAVYECVYRIQRKCGKYVWVLARGMVTERDANGKPLRMVGTHTCIQAQKLIEENFQNLFYRHPQPLMLCDGDERIAEANAAAESLYGYSREQLLTMQVSDLRSDKNEDHTSGWKETFTDPEKLQRQLHYNNQGHVFYADVNSSAINYSGKEMLLLAVSDVTEKVEAEIKIKQSESAYRSLFINNPLPCLIFQSASGAIEETNAAAIRFFTPPSGTLAGTKLETLFPNLVSRDNWLLSAQPTQIFTSTYTSQSGKRLQLELHQTSVSLRPDITHFLVVVHDLTLINEAKESLQRSNQRFQLISDISMDAVYDYDAHTEIMQWNDGLTRLFGHQNKLMSVPEWSDQVHEHDRPTITQSLTAALFDPASEQWVQEYRFRHADGSYRQVLDRAVFVRNNEGTVQRMIGAMRDITDSWHQQGLLRIEKKIFKQSNGLNSKPEQLCKDLVQGVETLHPHLRCAIITVNAQQFMRTIAAPNLDPAYVREIDGLQIGPHVTSFGKAMYTGKPVITTNVLTDAAWQNFRFLVRTYELTACWAWPVFSANQTVLGALVVYCAEERGPNELELKAMNRCQNMLQLIFHNFDAAAQIRLYNERLNSVMKATHDLVWDWNLETGAFFRDESCVQAVYGLQNPKSLNNIYNLFERVHPDDLPLLERSINEALTQPDASKFEIEYRFQNDANEYIYIFDRAVVIRGADGKAVRMVGAAQNITERKLMEQAFLQQELDKQRLISKATIETQEKERGHIGKELHDNVNQILTTTKLYLELAQTAPELKDELIEKSGRSISNVINEIRSLSRSLMDPTLGDLGLIESINDLVANVNFTQKIKARLQVYGKPEQSLNNEQQLMVFRIIQEMTNNVLKHAKAEHLTIELSLAEEAQQFNLTVTDDGQGFDMANVKKGSGLLNIQNRASLVNGQFSINSTAAGTSMNISFPIK